MIGYRGLSLAGWNGVDGARNRALIDGPVRFTDLTRMMFNGFFGAGYDG